MQNSHFFPFLTPLNDQIVKRFKNNDFEPQISPVNPLRVGRKMIQLLHFEDNKNFSQKSKSQFYLSLSDCNQVQF